MSRSGAHDRIGRLGAAAVVVGVVALLAACAPPTVSGPASGSRSPVVTTTPPTTGQPVTAPSTSTVAPAAAAPAMPAPPGWSPTLTTLPPAGGFTSVSCISDTFCIAAGGGANRADVTLSEGAGVTESWDGETWSAPSTYYPPPTGSGPWPVMPAISCTSGPFCVVVDASGFVSNGDGTTWITPVPLPPAPTPAGGAVGPGSGSSGSPDVAVDCPSAKFCTMVNGAATVWTWRQGSWLATRSFGSTSGAPAAGGTAAGAGQGRVGMSCAGADTCTAVVGTAVLDWDGSTWTREPAPWTPVADPHGADVACPTPTLCAIVGGPGLSFRNGSTTWSSGQVIDPGGALDSISCPSSSFCVAIDTRGDAVQWNGLRWSAPVAVIPPASEYTGDGTSVSCTAGDFCMVIDGDGQYSTFTPPSAVGAGPSSAGPSSG